MTHLRPLHRLVAVAVCALAASAALGCGAGQARAARNMEVALQDDAVFVDQARPYYRDRDRAFRLARSLGVTRLRVGVVWAYLTPPNQRNLRRRPANPIYEFGLIDNTIAQAARYGIRVHLTLTGPAPAWATSNKKMGVVRPNARYFAQFAAAAAAHFRGHVDRYSIWNEPNWHSWLSPLRSSPTLYRGLYVGAYKAIKRADPRAKVLIGETSPFARKGLSLAPLAFLRKALCVNKRYRRVSRRCPRLKADGYAQHPYDFTHSATFQYPGKDNVTIGTLSRLTRALDRLSRSGALRHVGGGRMPVYLTEYGYFSSGPRALSKRKRTKYLKQGFGLALKNGRVKSMLQYLLIAIPKGRSGSYFSTGLVTTRGRKLPTYNALQSFYRQHRGSLKRPGGPIGF